MTSSKAKTHILVVPYPAPGHMLPLFSLTHKLALRGLAITILVSPKNQPLLSSLLSLHPSIQTLVLPFPPHPSIPAGVENMQELPLSFVPRIVSALQQLYDPVLQWFQTHPEPPVAILSGIFQSWWTTRLCNNLGIKRIGFTPTNGHPLCSWWCEEETDQELLASVSALDYHQADLSSWGFIINSFDELESQTLNQLKKKFLRHDRVWAVGPLLPIKHEDGPINSKQTHRAIAWLDSCPVDESVVYVGFGTQITLTGQQMEGLAAALEASGVKFIWSIKPPMKGVQVAEDQNVVPTGFEDRVSRRGIIMRDWVPQAEILDHRAVGAYLTHCGWNSALEGLCAGVLQLAWPMQADHFFNANLLVDELGVAIRICEGLGTVPDSIKVAQILAESVNGTRPEKVRAMEMKSLALQATKEGGSSYNALDEIVDELTKLNSK
ncbi:hypothetical protein LguiB_012887 [Lonicera macranthoides]